MKNCKTLLLTLLLSIGFVLPSCKKEKLIYICGGPDSKEARYFDIKGVEAHVFENSINGFEFISPLDTIVYTENIGIYMVYQADYHAALLPSLSLMNSAMACSYAAGYDGSKTERLEDISIVTLNDFDVEHPANSVLNDLLEVQLGTFNEDNISLVEYQANQTENIKQQTLLLKLNKAPEINSEFKFKIEVKLSTGERYEVESDPIYFK